MDSRALLIGIVLFAVPALASHPQPDTAGETVTFQHKAGGNAWWVEVIIGGSAQVSKVEVRDDGGPWAAMEHKPAWGSWALSYPIEPGHRVTFRATTPGGVVTSCPFTHPAGAEQCGSPPPPGTGYDATFAKVQGNAWWVQAQVTSPSGVSKVDVTTDGGNSWRPLSKQSWGTGFWAASYHLPSGTIVQLRATDGAGGATDTSACHRWVPPPGQDAATVACTTQSPSKQWLTEPVHPFEGFVADMGIGDPDNDGRSELYLAAQGGVFRMPHGATSPERIVPLQFDGMTVADGDNDGAAEIYATSTNGDLGVSRLHRIHWTGQEWAQQVIHATDDFSSMRGVTVGDADNDGRREVYVALNQGSSAAVLRVAKGTVGWQGDIVADLGDDGKFLDIIGMWIGDGDADGRLELALSLVGYGYGVAALVEREGGTWRTVRPGGFGGAPSDVVAGDVDGDGKGEIVVGDDAGVLHIYRLVADVWEEETAQLPGLDWLTDIFLADGDNDGDAEMYVGGYDGFVWQVEWHADHWEAALVQDSSGVEDQSGPHTILVGNADGGAGNEVYSLLSSHRFDRDQLVRAFWGDPFTATVSNVRGNEWWVEAVIRANYDIYAVMVIFDCDRTRDPADMSYKADWGKWVLGGTHVPAGTKVVFWVIGEHGDMESQGYIWPTGAPTEGC